MLDKEERGALPRFKEFLDGYASEHIERERLQLGVTEGERDHVKFVYHNPGVKIPSHLTQSSGIMARFPTPAGVIKKVSDATLLTVCDAGITSMVTSQGTATPAFLS